MLMRYRGGFGTRPYAVFTISTDYHLTWLKAPDYLHLTWLDTCSYIQLELAHVEESQDRSCVIDGGFG
jgi:hypothetical protein